MTLEQRITALATRIGNYLRDSVVPRLLPTGGSAGQVLAKLNATDFAVGWQNSAAGGDAWTRVGLASDHVNATVAFTDVPGWSVTVPANSNFTIECDLILAAVTTTNLPRFGFNWNAAFAWAVGELVYDSSATAKVYANGLNLAAAGNLQMAAGTAPVAGAYGARAYLKGRTGGAPVTIKAQLAAETAAANAATLKRGSEFRSRVGP